MCVEILLWLVPAAATTLVAMAWVAWLGRDGRGEVDRDVLLARFADAMERDHPARTRVVRETPRDRSTGLAVRRPRPHP